MPRARARAVGRAALLVVALSSIGWAGVDAQAPRRPSFDERTEVERIVRVELSRFPRARPVDLYALIYHAANGAGNDGADAPRASARLRSEWAALKKPFPGERLLDTISPDGQFVRLNLRPWKAAGGTRGPVGLAFIATAHEVKADDGRLEHYWRIVETMGTDNKLPWPVDSVSTLGRQMAGSGFPPAAHSRVVVRTYVPAYRVLTAAHADALIHSLPRSAAIRR